MKILWIDLNSSYAHASLALPAIHAQIKGNPVSNGKSYLALSMRI